MRVFIPQDIVSIALGADKIAKKCEYAKLEVVRNGSRGLHYLEPLVEIELEGTRYAYGPINEVEIEELIANEFSPDHPKYLGETEKIPEFARQTRQTFVRCGLIDPLDYDGFLSLGGGLGLKKAREIGAQNCVEEIKNSGLRGRGGAGFPTGIKWQTVKDAQSAQKYIVCNADEGDSGNFADRALMEGDPFGLIESMTIAGYALGANMGYIYVRSEYPKAIQILNDAIKIAKTRGLLDDAFNLEVIVGAGAYVCGEETALLESIEGKRGMVRAKPPLPALQGLWGCPTLINNVLSLGAVSHIIRDGASSYSSLGLNRSKGTMAVQLSGNIKKPGLYELPFGLSLRELIMDMGGGTRSGRPFGAAQIGGPLGAYMTAKHLDLPFAYEELAANGGLLGHGSIVVFDETIDYLKMARFAFEFCAAESCGKCTPCRIGSTRGVETMDRIINLESLNVAPSERERAERKNNFSLIDDLCETMKFGSLCALGGFTPYPVQSALKAHFEKGNV